jgi:serine/threonine protein kinase
MAVSTLRQPDDFHSDGTVFAGYLIQSLVGRGDTAFVYRARDLRLNRAVALKVLAPGLARDPALRLLFLRESQLTASLDHPNVLPIYDAGEAEGTVFIAMRYVEGPTLEEILAAEGRLAPGRLLLVLEQVADALDAAHRLGLLHRDLKPRDVFVVPSADGAEHVYLSDFGVTDLVARRTRGASFIEFRHYAAPEQRYGLPDTARTDVYALGCLAHESLTGAAPADRPDEAIPAPVREVLARATADDADARYPTCGAFVAELARAQALAVDAEPRRRSAVTGFRQLVSTAGRRAAGRRRTRTLALLGAVLGVIALAAAMIAFGTQDTKRLEPTDALPLSMSYPRAWQSAGSENPLVLSPHAAELQAIFSDPRDPSDWASARKVVRGSADLVGVALWTLPEQAGVPPAKAGEKLLQSELAGDLSKVQLMRPVLGEPVAARVDAVLADPVNPSAQLAVQCYVIPVPSKSQIVFAVFFAAEKQLVWRKTALDDVARSIELGK